MTHEELRAKLASMILEAIMFKKSDEQALCETIDQALFDGPCDSIRVTISVEGFDRASLRESDRASITQSKDHETMTVLCVQLRVDGKDSSERIGGPACPNANDYILTTPCADTPPIVED